MARVLLVEDEEIIRQLVTIRLEMAGHEIAYAEDGKAGMEAALAETPDLVLMDMNMPVMGGSDAVAGLREQGYEGRVVALTASTDRAENEKALAAGFDAIMKKPIDSDFEALVAEHVATAGAED